MLLTITTTYQPATDLGYLLHKHPARVQSFDLSFGKANIFYPEASEARCTAAMLLDIDPIDLVRGGHGSAGLAQYVTDRPYVASSFLSVAIARIYRTALAGRCKERPALVETPIPLQVRIAVLPSRGGKHLLQRLFEPLGYTITAERHPLDESFPAWGMSSYFTVTLEQTIRLQVLLSHLYVLVPVLDDEKHYFVDEDEIEKLLRRGEGWLKTHPARDLIGERYLKHQRHLVREMDARLADSDTPATDDDQDAEEATIERSISLHEHRLETVLAALKEGGARRVMDLGCGEGRLLQRLLREKQFDEILGMDVSMRALQRARDRLKLDRKPAHQRTRIDLIQGSLIYRDSRLAGYDAATVVEVVEHLDPARLAAFERVLFEFARPTVVLLTTPNREYNVMWESLPAGQFRHRDHRFEWSRTEFARWAERVAEQFGYRVRLQPIGPEDPSAGAPSQMALFELDE